MTKFSNVGNNNFSKIICLLHFFYQIHNNKIQPQTFFHTPNQPSKFQKTKLIKFLQITIDFTQFSRREIPRKKNVTTTTAIPRTEKTKNTLVPVIIVSRVWLYFSFCLPPSYLYIAWQIEPIRIKEITMVSNHYHEESQTAIFLSLLL